MISPEVMVNDMLLITQEQLGAYSRAAEKEKLSLMEWASKTLRRAQIPVTPENIENHKKLLVKHIACPLQLKKGTLTPSMRYNIVGTGVSYDAWIRIKLDEAANV